MSKKNLGKGKISETKHTHHDTANPQQMQLWHDQGFGSRVGEREKMLKRAIEAEVEGDVFDRQRCVEGWRQDLVEKQRCLVLGAGAIGCSCAMALARVGVARIVLVDRDVVEPSNLNRQLLFGRADVGRRKVDAAADCLRRYHCAGAHTVVDTMHCDVTARWAAIVAEARASTVIFNTIDIGAQFDYAVLALARKLGVPCASGSSFGRQWMFEFFSPDSAAENPTSFSLENREGPADVFVRLHPDRIAELETLDFVTRDANPPTRAIGSTVVVAASAGINAVNAWLLGLMGIVPPAQIPNFCKVDVASFWMPDSTLAFPQPTETEPLPK